MNKFKLSGFIIRAYYYTDMSDILTAASAGEKYEISFAQIFSVDFHTIRVLYS